MPWRALSLVLFMVATPVATFGALLVSDYLRARRAAKRVVDEARMRGSPVSPQPHSLRAYRGTGSDRFGASWFELTSEMKGPGCRRRQSTPFST